MSNTHSRTLTVVERQILRFLEKNGVSLPTELEKCLPVTPARICSAVAALEKKQLVAVAADDGMVKSVRMETYP